jgi:hypothetical protein
MCKQAHISREKNCQENCPTPRFGEDYGENIMSIDELSRTLNVNDEMDRFKIVLDLLISIETYNRSIIDFLAVEKAKGDPDLHKTYVESFQNSQKEQREFLIQKLYEKFGSLPDDL